MKNFICIMSVLLLLAACGNATRNKEKNSLGNIAATDADMGHKTQSLNISGTYKGVFPAADCPGIETTLVLKADSTFSMLSIYIDRDTQFDEKGTYSINDSLLTLKSGDEGTSFFKIKNGQLRKLMADKQEITGELAEHFVLNKER